MQFSRFGLSSRPDRGGPPQVRVNDIAGWVVIRRMDECGWTNVYKEYNRTVERMLDTHNS